MEMRKLTREARLNRWSEVLRERQSSGMTVTAWCEANGVDKQRYFYWQRKLREAACEPLRLSGQSETMAAASPESAHAAKAATAETTALTATTPAAKIATMTTAVVEPTEFAEYSLSEIALSSMVPASTTPPPEPAPSSSAPKPDAGSVAMVVHLACGSIEIRNGANRETIENTLLTLIKLC